MAAADRRREDAPGQLRLVQNGRAVLRANLKPAAGLRDRQLWFAH
jgi:hypothetical protein